MLKKILATSTLLGALFAAALRPLPAFAQAERRPDQDHASTTGPASSSPATSMGEVLKKAGYNVEYVHGRLSGAVRRPRNRRSDARHGNLGDHRPGGAWTPRLATGKTENLGETGMHAKEEWWFPEYMKEKCPGLPNWEALKEPACAEAFSTAETAPKGRYLGGPVTWGGFDEERVEALGLPFEVVHAGTDAAMFAELESRLSAQGADHAVDLRAALGAGQVQGRMGRIPDYTPECYTDPAWGSNPDASL